MSGGSYNNLYIKDIQDLIHNQDLEDMANRLAHLGYAEDAARETMDLLMTIRAFYVRAEVIKMRLSEVWRAVEWYDSRDAAEDVVKLALAKYRHQTAMLKCDGNHAGPRCADPECWNQ